MECAQASRYELLELHGAGPSGDGDGRWKLSARHWEAQCRQQVRDEHAHSFMMAPRWSTWTRKPVSGGDESTPATPSVTI